MRDIPAGEAWAEEIESAILACPFFLLLLSPSSVESEYVKSEYTFALENRRKLIPIVVENCEMPGVIQPIQYIDCQDYETGLRKLLAVFPDDAFEREQTVDGLLSQLKNPNREIRMGALAYIWDAKIVETLDAVAALLKDSDAEVRASAAAALSQFKTIDALPHLLAALYDPSYEVRSNAGWGLVYLGRNVVPDVIRVLDDSSKPGAQEMAYQVLIRIATPEAKEAASRYKNRT